MTTTALIELLTGIALFSGIVGVGLWRAQAINKKSPSRSAGRTLSKVKS